MKKEYDFSRGKRGAVVKARGKTRITIHLDNEIIKAFRVRAEKTGRGYQTLINQTLRRGLGDPPLDEETLRSVIREELGRYAISEQPDTD